MYSVLVRLSIYILLTECEACTGENIGPPDLVHGLVYFSLLPSPLTH